MSSRVVRALPVAFALLAIAVLAWLFAQRVAYPFELEWMEGGMLAHVKRVRDGLPIYAEPSLEFGAFPYTPLFVWVSTGASFLVGETLVAARLVSTLSAVCVLLLLFDIGRRQRGVLAGLLSAGFFAAGFQWAGAWLDVGRVDSLSFALALGTLHVALFGGSTRSALLAALLAVGACLTKQSALLLVLACTPAFARFGARRASTFVVAFSLLMGAAIVVLQIASDGWFKFWVWDMLRSAPVHGPAVLGYWVECGTALGAALALIAAALVTRSWPGPGVRGALPCAALIATGWIGRAHEGGAANNLIASLLAVALPFGPAAAAWMSSRRTGLAAICTALAFIPLTYDPRPLVPTDADRDAGERITRTLRDLEHPVFLPAHSYLIDRASLSTSTNEPIGVVHSMVINDLLKSGLDEAAGRWVAALVAALDEKRFGAVILDEPWPGLLALPENYGPPELLFDEDDDAFFPVTGAPRRPTLLFRKR